MDDKQNRQPLRCFPKQIMNALSWSFMGEKYQSRLEFDAEVREVQIELRKIDSWQSDEVVLQSPRIGIQYHHAEGGFYKEDFFEIESHNGEFFTAGELLFKVHNAVVEQLREIDHHFFEGFYLLSIRSRDNLPVYRLRQGS